MTEAPSRSKHPATGARIAATGISTTSMLAIMVALGSTPAQSEPEAAGSLITNSLPVLLPAPSSVAVTPAIPAQSGVAATQLPSNPAPTNPVQIAAPAPVVTAAPAPAAPPTPTTAAPTTAAPSPANNEPVQLTPTQVVTVITAAPAPAAPAPKTKTKGS